MQFTSVSSSNIAAIGYDSASRKLVMKFLNGTTYEYSGVPENVYRALMSASSHGKYFDANINKGGYSCRQIG